MRGRIARVDWRWKEAAHLWIELERPRCPTGVFGVPARDGGVERGHAQQRVDAGGTRRIDVEVVLGDPLVGEQDPVRAWALPVEGRRIAHEGAGEVLDLLQLGELLRRVGCWWRRRTQ